MKKWLGQLKEKCVLRYYHWRDDKLMAGYRDLIKGVGGESFIEIPGTKELSDSASSGCPRCGRNPCMSASFGAIDALKFARLDLIKMADKSLLGVPNQPVLDILHKVEQSEFLICLCGIMTAHQKGDGALARSFFRMGTDDLPDTSDGQKRFEALRAALENR